jgi:hypothetical protein
MTPRSPENTHCPLCGNEDNCGANEDGPCWCDVEGVPMELRELISPGKRMKKCICQNCVREFKADPEGFKEKLSLEKPDLFESYL